MRPSAALKFAGICSNVLAIFANLAVNISVSRTALVAAGVVPHLVEILHSKCKDSQEKAAAALGNLALGGPENQVLVAAAGAIGPLVKLPASDSEAVLICASAALVNLAFNADLKGMFTSAGAFAPLVRLLQSECETVQENAARVIVNLTDQDGAKAGSPSDIAAAGGIPPLVRLLRFGSKSAQMAAVTALAHLAVEGGVPQQDTIIIIKKAGALSLLAELMGNVDAESDLREHAALLLTLLRQSPDSKSPSTRRGNVSK